MTKLYPLQLVLLIGASLLKRLVEMGETSCKWILFPIASIIDLCDFTDWPNDKVSGAVAD